MKETASSKKVSAVKIVKGTKATATINKFSLLKNCIKKVLNIFNRVWPATMLLNNRTHKEKALAV